MPEHEDDMLDIVDEQGNVIDTVLFAEAHQKGLLHRFVRVLVVNENDEVILHKRSSTITDGGMLDSAGGHLDAGETYEKAVIRELQEEMGITASIDQLVLVGDIEDRSRPERENMVGRVYVLPKYSGACVAEEDEVSSFVYVPLSHLLDVEKLKNYGNPSPKLLSCVGALKSKGFCGDE